MHKSIFFRIFVAKLIFSAMTTQQQIESLLRSTGDQRIVNMIPVLAQSDFYVAKSGSHHHYKGGLAEHSLGVTELLLRDNNLLEEYGKTNMIIAGMFHDICMARHPAWSNIGVKTNGHRMHGTRSVRILGEYFHMHLDDEVYHAIKYHKKKPHVDAKGCPCHPFHSALYRADHANAATKSIYAKVVSSNLS